MAGWAHAWPCLHELLGDAELDRPSVPHGMGGPWASPGGPERDARCVPTRLTPYGSLVNSEARRLGDWESGGNVGEEGGVSSDGAPCLNSLDREGQASDRARAGQGQVSCPDAGTAPALAPACWLGAA